EKNRTFFPKLIGEVRGVYKVVDSGDIQSGTPSTSTSSSSTSTIVGGLGTTATSYSLSKEGRTSFLFFTALVGAMHLDASLLDTIVVANLTFVGLISIMGISFSTSNIMGNMHEECEDSEDEETKLKAGVGCIGVDIILQSSRSNFWSSSLTYLLSKGIVQKGHPKKSFKEVKNVKTRLRKVVTLIGNYELFSIKNNETIDEMFEHFQTIFSEPNRTIIQEVCNIKNLTLNELLGVLRVHLLKRDKIKSNDLLALKIGK
ncbi:hypothetical protein CR513_41525, partial [Mucuna pruriens]